MSLNNKQMLPDRVRSMRQMKELINAEDIILGMLEEMIDQMYQRASLLHKELVNEQWLESKIGELINGIVHVSKKTEQLRVEITLNTDRITCLESEKIINFINKWLPAHLAYTAICEKKY